MKRISSANNSRDRWGSQILLKTGSRDPDHAPLKDKYFLWLILATVYLHIEFEVSSFPEIGDVPNLKSGSRDPAHAPLRGNYLLLASTCHGPPTYQL